MASKKIVYTEEERKLLTRLVTKYTNVLENKKTDATSLNAKARTWDKVMNEYNSQFGIRPRDVKQLKKLWDNQKTRWRTAKAKQVRDVFATGKSSQFHQFLFYCLLRTLAIIPQDRGNATRWAVVS